MWNVNFWIHWSLRHKLRIHYILQSGDLSCDSVCWLSDSMRWVYVCVKRVVRAAAQRELSRKQLDMWAAGEISCSHLCGSCTVKSLQISLSPHSWHLSCNAIFPAAVCQRSKPARRDIEPSPPDARIRLCFTPLGSPRKSIKLKVYDRFAKVLEEFLGGKKVFSAFIWQQLMCFDHKLHMFTHFKLVGVMKNSPASVCEAEKVAIVCWVMPVMLSLVSYWLGYCAGSCQKRQHNGIWTSMGAGSRDQGCDTMCIFA